MTQTNTQPGPIALTASEDIAANRLIAIGQSGGNPVALLPNSGVDEVPFVSEDAVDSGERVTLLPLYPAQSARVTLSGTCAPGDLLVLSTDGVVVKQPTAAGTYRLIGIAEETGANGQAVLLRPVGQRLITVT